MTNANPIFWRRYLRMLHIIQANTLFLNRFPLTNFLLLNHFLQYLLRLHLWHQSNIFEKIFFQYISSIYFLKAPQYFWKDIFLKVTHGILNPERLDPGPEENISCNFYFNSSLQYLKKRALLCCLSNPFEVTQKFVKIKSYVKFLSKNL